MAQINVTRWSRFVLRVSQGGSPESFVPLCSINSSTGINFNANVTEDAIPDCDDLQKVQWLIREKVSLSADVSGSGRVHKQNVETFYNWVRSEDSIRCQVVLDDPVAANVITFEGDYHLTGFNMSGDSGSPSVTGEIALQSSGEVTATFGANVSAGS